MAGIAGGTVAVPEPVHAMLNDLVHRGPDRHVLAVRGNTVLGQVASSHEQHNSQPYSNEDHTLHLVCDGAIYNAAELRQYLISRGHQFQTPSNVEVIVHLYEEDGPDAVLSWEGIFALALATPDGLFLARDPLGVKPLYVGYTAGGELLFSSELRPLLPYVERVEEFPPGHYWTPDTGFVRYFSLPPVTEDAGDTEKATAEILDALQDSVHNCLLKEEPVGVFLSGGLDSSLVAALAANAVGEQDAGPGSRAGAAGTLHSFAVGMAGSEDLSRARQVAAALGTTHHEYAFTPEEVVEALPAVVARLESFDAALVRGSLANHFAAKLASRHVHTIMSGEGADELFGGYHYLKIPQIRRRLQEELQHITAALHHTSLQRVDRMTSSQGLDIHLPFLSPKVLELAWRIPADWKISPSGIEKWILRRAAQKVLPDSITRRQKAKFATGTGVGPFLEKYADSIISDSEYEAQAELLAAKGVRLLSKEECLYFRFFADAFGDAAIQAARLIGRSRSINEDQLNVME